MSHYIRSIEPILKVAGLYVPPPNSSLFCKAFYRIYLFWVVLWCIAFTVSSLLAYEDYTSDLAIFILMASSVPSQFSAILKWALWVSNRTRFIEIFDKLDCYSRFYQSYDDFHPKQIIKDAKKLKNKFLFLYFGLGMLIAYSGALVVFKQLIENPSNEEGYTNLTSLSLAYVGVIPFEFRTSKIRCSMAILYQTFGSSHYVWAITALDCVYFSIVSYISVHLLIIQGAFRTLRNRCFLKLGIDVKMEFLRNPPHIQKIMDKEINRITHHFQTIVEISDDIESIYNFIILVQTMISLFLICTCLYMTSTVPALSLPAAKELIYFLVALMQLIMYCYFGNQVTINSESIALGIYSMDWYATTTSFKRTMILNMMRSQRGVFFTIGKFTTLTLSTIVTILRGSYSFFALLKNS